MGGSIPGGNFLGENFPGIIFQGWIWWVGIFRVGIFLEPRLLSKEMSNIYDWKIKFSKVVGKENLSERTFEEMH